MDFGTERSLIVHTWKIIITLLHKINNLLCCRNQAILNYIVTTPEPILYKTKCTGAERHTGEYIADELIQVIEELGPAKVIGLVTDNAAAMEKAKRLVIKKFNHITAYSCIAHTLNLLVGDIMQINSLRTVEASCKEIVKEINGSHLTLAVFNQIQKEKKGSVMSLKLPVKTRWGSILQCMESLNYCKYALKLLVVTEDATLKIGNNVKRNCLDDDVFWVRIEKLIDVLRPIVKWITILEGNSLGISQVVEAFKELTSVFSECVPSLPITKKEEKDMILFLKNRKKMALKPLHFAANLLDPKFCGKYLTCEEQVEAIEFIHNFVKLNDIFINDKDIIIEEITKYIAHVDIWSKSFIWEVAASVDSVTWWQGMCNKTSLKNIANAILTLPASSAATERTFSTYSLVHTAKRNKLTVKRAGMLTYISHNLKLATTSTTTITKPNTNTVEVENVTAEKALIKISENTAIESKIRNEDENKIDSYSSSESENESINISLHDTTDSNAEERDSETEDEDNYYN